MEAIDLIQNFMNMLQRVERIVITGNSLCLIPLLVKLFLQSSHMVSDPY